MPEDFTEVAGAGSLQHQQQQQAAGRKRSTSGGRDQTSMERQEDDERPAKVARLDPEASQNSDQAQQAMQAETGLLAVHNAKSAADMAADMPEPGSGNDSDDSVDKNSREEPAVAGPDGASQPGEPADTLSRKQQRRLEKRQRWEAGREERKSRRKERRTRKRERQLQDREQNGDEGGAPVQSRKKRKSGKTVPLPIAIVLDCGFDDLMLEKEVVSLSSQITRCYSDNAAAGDYKMHLYISGLDRRLKERFDTVLRGQHRSWKGVKVSEDALDRVIQDISFTRASAEKQETAEIWSAAELAVTGQSSEQPSKESTVSNDSTVPDAIPDINPDTTSNLKNAQLPDPIGAQDTVYLTADSNTTLTHLSPYTTYIIGALVDRNRHKNVCRDRAAKLGLRTAKLPISQHLAMASRKVLATNHVVQILLQWCATRDWGEALEKVMPARKGGVRKGADQTEDGDALHSSEDEDQSNPGDDTVAEKVAEADDGLAKVGQSVS